MPCLVSEVLEYSRRNTLFSPGTKSVFWEWHFMYIHFLLRNQSIRTEYRVRAVWWRSQTRKAKISVLLQLLPVTTWLLAKHLPSLGIAFLISIKWDDKQNKSEKHVIDQMIASVAHYTDVSEQVPESRTSLSSLASLGLSFLIYKLNAVVPHLTAVVAQ